MLKEFALELDSDIMIFLLNKFQYHIIAVSFLRSAVRIYKSVNYKMFFSYCLLYRILFCGG